MEPKEKALFDKDGFKFSKLGQQQYLASFSLENDHVNLANMIHFDLIKLIYDLNSDIYESVKLDKINENEATITLVFKHFFEDLGIPQKYSYMHMKRIVNAKSVVFDATSIRSSRPANVPADSQIVAFSKMSIACEIITPHKINFTYSVHIDEDRYIPPFIEKFISIITNKIFKRVKEFIDKL